MSEPDGQFDVAIVGAGMVGQACALALANPVEGPKLRVALIDGRDPAGFSRPGFDPRASAVTATSRVMLEVLGVWPALGAHAQEMREIKVTDSRPGAAARPALLYFGAAPNGRPSSAHMVENVHIYGALYVCLSACENVSLHPGVKVAHVDFSGPQARLALEDGRVVAAPLVVAADGRRSPVRAQAGIETVGWSYPQHGIVTTVCHARAHDGIAEEHFLPAGPFAILPLTGNRSSLVWTEDADEAERLVAGPDDVFAAEMTRRFGDHLGAVTPVGPRVSFPLSMFLARDYVAPRLALVGDAAHSVHPIAGLGFNLGLRDAAALADVVSDHVGLGLDIGSLAALGDYQADRRFDNALVAFATDGLNRLFSNDNAALRAVRDIGLTMVDRADPIKRFFMDQAAGRHAGLPRLMRGRAVRQ
ncbi:MAG: FAD-dependent monooxygenase [Hyphomicrobiales bacterium]